MEKHFSRKGAKPQRNPSKRGSALRRCAFCEKPSSRSLAFPQPSGEVRKFHRHTSPRHRNLTEWTRHTPRRRIVNIDIRLEPLAHALHEAITHQVIHAAMSTEFARHLTLVLPQRRFILLFILVERGPRVMLRLPVNVNARWIIAKNPFRALDQVDAIVRSRRRHVVLQ